MQIPVWGTFHLVAGQKEIAFFPLYKVAVHSFVENLFRSIWGTKPQGRTPQAIKYFFDFLDTQADNMKITDPDVLHIWKTNRYCWIIYSSLDSGQLLVEVFLLEPTFSCWCPQFTSALLGQYPEKPPVCFWHGEDSPARKLPKCHHSGFHGLILPQRYPARKGNTKCV